MICEFCKYFKDCDCTLVERECIIPEEIETREREAFKAGMEYVMSKVFNKKTTCAESLVQSEYNKWKEDQP